MTVRAHLTARESRTSRWRDILPLLAVALPALALVALVATHGLSHLTPAPREPAAPLGPRAAALVAYAHAVRLTAEQQRVVDAAARTVPMPCHRGKTLADHCCSCNLGRSIDGLIKEQVARHGASAEQAAAAAAEWIRSVNPHAYSGGTCPEGRCDRPFADDGCGGMKEHGRAH